MRVWIVNWFADRSGGADVYSEQLAIGLAERGHTITVVCYDASPAVDAVCHVVRVARPDHLNWPVLWRFAPALVALHWMRVVRRIDEPTPDVIVFSPAVTHPALNACFPQVPRIYLPHARIAPLEVAGAFADHQSRVFRWIGVQTQRWCERAALRRSIATVRFTEGAIASMRAFYRLSSHARFELIPAAVNTSAISHLESNAGALRLLAVGRLVESKNLAFLLACLKDCLDLPWTLDVIGEGPERPTLESEAATLGLTDRVTFHGHTPDTDYYYARSDLLAFPSRLESFGLVTIEAMAHGVPAIVVRADGVKYQNVHDEIIRSGVDGLIAEDEAGFRAQLRNCIEDPGSVHKLGLAARDTAAKHTWPTALDHWEQLLSRQSRS